MKTIVLVVFGLVLISNVRAVASGGRYPSFMLKLGKVLIAGFLTEMILCQNCPQYHLPNQCIFRNRELCICMLYRELGLLQFCHHLLLVADGQYIEWAC